MNEKLGTYVLTEIEEDMWNYHRVGLDIIDVFRSVWGENLTDFGIAKMTEEGFRVERISMSGRKLDDEINRYKR